MARKIVNIYFRLLFSWSLYAFFILTGQHAIPLVECLAECRLRCVARQGDDRFEWQVSCVHEVCGSLHTPSLDILHRWFSHDRLEALGRGSTRISPLWRVRTGASPSSISRRPPP